jgi:hypothetical protein
MKVIASVLKLILSHTKPELAADGQSPRLTAFRRKSKQVVPTPDHNAQSPVYRCSFKDCITLLHPSNASAIDWYRLAISSMCLMPSRSC